MSTKTNMETEASGTAVTALPAAVVVERVREWVDEYARDRPDFAGAYLWGGITALPLDATFPLYRDVDVVIVSTEGSREGNDEIAYRGLMLEVLTKGIDKHQNVEQVLADPSHAPNMVATTILRDPTGLLVPFQQAVAAQFARRRWVRARCEAEKAMAHEFLAVMRAVDTATDGVNHLWLVLYALSGLLAVAQLGRPTTRRTMALLRELLAREGRLDLHEEALAIWGAAHMSRSEVEGLLDVTTAAYDRAVAVYQTPTELGFTLREHLRPYLVEASREMIDEGLHREATFWIMAVAGESYLALFNDAPPPEKPVFAAQWQQLHDAFGYTTMEAWSRRADATEQLAQEIFRIADDLAAQHPE